MDIDELSDVSDEELNKILFPYSTKPTEPQQIQQPEQQSLEAQQQRSKSEKQKRKNQKLKWKRQNRADFNNKIKRPIYYKYDYRKIRAQLKDDKINTSHQITINKNRGEVIIGFKSKEEQERVEINMPANYFSREEHYNRWG